ncbi:hypothetical protein D3C87_1843920 [compost metagenome]
MKADVVDRQPQHIEGRKGPPLAAMVEGQPMVQPLPGIGGTPWRICKQRKQARDGQDMAIRANEHTRYFAVSGKRWRKNNQAIGPRRFQSLAG